MSGRSRFLRLFPMFRMSCPPQCRSGRDGRALQDRAPGAVTQRSRGAVRLHVIISVGWT